MRTNIAFTVIILASGSIASVANAQESCSLDLSGTVQTTGNYYQPWSDETPITTYSADARGTNDFLNAASNYFYFDPTGMGIRSFLRNVYGTPYPSSQTVSIPICNEIGQCATASIRAEIYYINYGLYSVPAGVTAWNVEVRLFNGETTGYRWPTSDGTPALAVPATGPRNPAQDDRCRGNDGVLTAEPTAGDVSAGDDSAYGDISEYSDYWNAWEEGLGGQTPSFICRPDFSDPAGSGVICSNW